MPFTTRADFDERAAIRLAAADAVFDAIGVRLRSVPYTPAKVLAAFRGTGARA